MNSVIIPTTLAFSLWNIVSIAVMFWMEILDPSLIAFGPNVPSANQIVNIRTWLQWSLLLIYTLVSQIALAVVKDTVGTWIKNKEYVRSPSQTATLTIMTYHLSCWATRVVYIYVLMTQVDIILTTAVANMVASVFITGRYMNAPPKRVSLDYDRLDNLGSN